MSDVELSVMATTLNECQRSEYAHRKGTHTLTMLLPSTAAVDSDMSDSEDEPEVAPLTLSEFNEEFVSHAKRTLVVYKREPAVERLITFMTTFAASHDEVATNLLSELVALHNAKDKAVRFRVCQYIELVMNNLGEDCEIDDALWESLQTALLCRTKDKIALVRTTAARAMVRLQDTEAEEKAIEAAEAAKVSSSEETKSDTGGAMSESEIESEDEDQDGFDSDDSDKPDGLDPKLYTLPGGCPVIAEFRRLMAADSSSGVREAATEGVVFTSSTLADIVNRTRDTNKSVRAAAFKKMEAIYGSSSETA